MFCTALSSRIGRTIIATFLNFYVSHASATKFLRNSEQYYLYFVNNLLMFHFPTVKECSKSVEVGEVIAKSSTPRFFETQCSLMYCTARTKRSLGASWEFVQSPMTQVLFSNDCIVHSTRLFTIGPRTPQDG